MNSTLLYFFSAVFQGFAAIITLGSMFYLYYINKFYDKYEWILNELRRQFIDQRAVMNEIESKGVILYCKEHVENVKKNNWDSDTSYIQTRLNEYDILQNKHNLIKKYVPSILYLTMIILVVSLVSLFLIDISNRLNKILFWIGVMTGILSIVDFMIIIRLIKQIIEDKQ